MEVYPQKLNEKITSDIKPKAENTKHRAEKRLGFIKTKIKRENQKKFKETKK